MINPRPTIATGIPATIAVQHAIAKSSTSERTFERVAPIAVGFISFAFVWWLWGSLSKLPGNHDEAAYVLQARIFASGRLVAPARPLPQFFEQFHTFVEPVVAAKYPPGFSVLLVPGIWIGLPGLIPALLAAMCSALLFVLARRYSGLPVALMSVVLAGTSDIALNFNPSYSSEVATSFLFMVGWWALAKHWDTGRSRWLIILALAVGWGAITRPLTMLAYAIPTGVATLFSISRHGSWRTVPYCLAIVGALLGFMAMWGARVTGNWRRSPHAEYARLYIPSDQMGFGIHGGAPARRLDDEHQAFREWVDSLHKGHTPENLPSIAAARTRGLMVETWSRDTAGALLAVMGFLCVAAPIARIVWATVLLVFGSHLLYAHALDWPVYYLELQGPLAFMAAAAGFAIASRVAALVARQRERPSSTVKSLLPSALADRRLLYALFSFWMLAPEPPDILFHRRRLRAGRAYLEHFRSLVDSLPSQPQVIFVKYAPGHSEHQSLVQNEPDSAARLWIVHDLGAENARLLTIAPDRRAYSYVETKSDGRVSGTIRPLNRGGTDP
jgi:hypothetical protein